MRKMVLVSCCLALAFNAFAADAPLEASGEAQVVNNDEVAAKQAAINDALKHCIERVVGITVQNTFTSEQMAATGNDQSTFQQRVHDAILQKSEGFVQTYDVMEAHRQGDVYHVTVRAVVFENKVQAEVKRLTDLLAKAGNPKFMVVIQEVYMEPDKSSHLNPDSPMRAQLERELLARGFELRGQERAKNLAGGTLDDAALVQQARQVGADVLLVGRVDVTNKGPLGGDVLEALRGQVAVDIACVMRGINVASEAMVSSKSVQMRSMGIDEDHAMHRAFMGRGQNLVQQLLDGLLPDLTTSLKKTAQDGQQYFVQLNGVGSYRNQGQRFLQVLQTMSDVSGVMERSFENGTLAVEVMCNCSTSQLQDRIFKATANDAALKSLDVSGVAGKRLTFKL